ncbi:MAG: YbaB/EbfC family nucleoid-associated protein [Limnochordales bacterium]|nr:YbaB/EbfC family nucleoid-associated protein [Limnochordales bacterium]
MNVQKLFKQAQKLQAEMARVQEELGQKTVEGTAGGQAVKVVANGKQEILSVTIDPAAVDPADVEMLQDLVLAAVNEALRKSRELASEEMARVTQAMGLPGLPGGLAGF